MTKVIMTVGCPASGKSTYARKLVEEQGYLTLSLDSIRTMTWGSKRRFWECFRQDRETTNELLVSIYNDALYNILLYGPDDLKLVLDNTHLSHFDITLRICENFGMRPELAVFLVPLEVLQDRNARRAEDDIVPSVAITNYYRIHNDPDVWWHDYEPKQVIQYGRQPNYA